MILIWAILRADKKIYGRSVINDLLCHFTSLLGLSLTDSCFYGDNWMAYLNFLSKEVYQTNEIQYFNEYRADHISYICL